jgi:hypothetical protein
VGGGQILIPFSELQIRRAHRLTSLGFGKAEFLDDARLMG